MFDPLAQVDYSFLGNVEYTYHRPMTKRERIIWRIKYAWAVLAGRKDNMEECDCDCDDDD